MKKTNAKSILTEADKTLFRKAVKHIKPMTTQKIGRNPPALKKPPSPSLDIEDELTDQETLPLVTSHGSMAFARPGVQHQLFRKLKSGHYPIEAILDLHGKTVPEAKSALAQFLQYCEQHHLKHVLMIHGKGRYGQYPILKNRLNHWLRESGRVLAFCTANLKQGHTGALYVLLRMR